MGFLSGGRLQPMFVDLDVDRIAIGAAVIGPNLALDEAHAIERLRRQAVAAEGQLLGVWEAAADAFDYAGLAADVVGRAQMARRIGAPHRHGIAGLEARAHAPSSDCWLTAAMRRPSSSVVMTPRATGAGGIDGIAHCEKHTR